MSTEHSALSSRASGLQIFLTYCTPGELLVRQTFSIELNSVLLWQVGYIVYNTVNISVLKLLFFRQDFNPPSIYRQLKRCQEAVIPDNWIFVSHTNLFAQGFYFCCALYIWWKNKKHCFDRSRWWRKVRKWTALFLWGAVSPGREEIRGGIVIPILREVAVLLEEEWMVVHHRNIMGCLDRKLRLVSNQHFS